MQKSAISATLAIFVGLVSAQAATEEEVKKAELDWAATVKKLDFAKLGQILGDQLVYAHSTGIVENKSEYLAKLKAGTQKYTGIEHLSMNIKTYGDTGVVASKSRMTGATKGVPFDNTLLMLHVWVKQGGRWQLVAHQTTKLP